MDGYIPCMDCGENAYYEWSGDDDFGRYRFYQCDGCGAGFNVYDTSESAAAYEALVEDALSDRDRGIVIDDDDPFMAWYQEFYDG